jgi:hypothetical protein
MPHWLTAQGSSSVTVVNIDSNVVTASASVISAPTHRAALPGHDTPSPAATFLLD